MAREKMVTRTIDTLWVTVLTLDTVTRESREILMPVNMVDDTDKMLKEAKKKTGYFNENEIPVTVLHYNVVSAKYGMTEDDFILHGTLLS